MIRNFLLRFTWYLLRILNPKLTFKEVLERKCFEKQSEQPLELALCSEESLDTLIDFAKSRYQSNETKKSELDNKVWNLLTLTAISIPVGAGFLADWPISIIGLIAIFLFSTSTLLLAIYWGTNTQTGLEFNSGFLKTSDSNVKRKMLKDYFNTNNENSRTIDFLMGVFGSVRRLFMVGFVFLLGNIFTDEIYKTLRPSGVSKIEESVETVIKKIKNDPEFIKILKGYP